MLHKKSNLHYTRRITPKRERVAEPTPAAQRLGHTASNKRRNGIEPLATL